MVIQYSSVNICGIQYSSVNICGHTILICEHLWSCNAHLWTSVAYNTHLWTSVAYNTHLWTFVAYNTHLWTSVAYNTHLWTSVAYNKSRIVFSNVALANDALADPYVTWLLNVVMNMNWRLLFVLVEPQAKIWVAQHGRDTRRHWLFSPLPMKLSSTSSNQYNYTLGSRVPVVTNTTTHWAA